MYCPQCGTQAMEGARFCSTCGAALQERAVSTLPIPPVNPAPFLVGSPPAVLAGSDEGVGTLVYLALIWLYFAVMESSEKQATIGKMVLGIIVVDLEGKKISFARATGRFLAKFLSNVTLLLGYIVAGFTYRKQALHDLIADTLVVVKPRG